VGGEALPESVARDLAGIAREGVYNMYGPTETTVWSSVYRLKGNEGAVPIGRPIANTQMYVLDSQMEPVPVGVAGELYIGGAGLARGYWKHPEMTAERFVPDPFSGRPGERLYRTGDRVRFRPDGCLDFLGRLDNQVKVRGFRIELGEIEATLLEHPQVQQTAVVVREHNNEKNIVAYVIASQTNITSYDLRQYLRQRLPDYMVPGAVMILPDMPLTPNGKVDRQALPVPPGKTSQNSGVPAAWGNDLEKQIAAIWRNLLRISNVHPDDNFFDIGGHSLLAARMRDALLEILAKDIAIIDLFTYPTIRSLATYLENHNQPAAAADGVPDRTRRRREYLKRRKQGIHKETLS
jgi:polyketide synthase PksJ